MVYKILIQLTSFDEKSLQLKPASSLDRPRPSEMIQAVIGQAAYA